MKGKKILAGLMLSAMLLTWLPIGVSAAGSLLFQMKVLVDGEAIYVPKGSLAGDAEYAFEGYFTLDGEALADADVTADDHLELDDLGDGQYRILLASPGRGSITVTVDGEGYTFPVNVYGDAGEEEGGEEELPEEEEPEPELIWSAKGSFTVSEDNDRVSLTVSEGFTIKEALLVGDSADFAALTYDEGSAEITFPYGYVGDRLQVRVYFNELGYNTTVGLRLKNGLPRPVFQMADGTACEALTLPKGEVAEGRFLLVLPDGTQAEAAHLTLPGSVDAAAADGGLRLTALEMGEDAAALEYNGRTYSFPITVDLPTLAFYSGKTAKESALIEEYTVDALGDEIYLIGRSPMENAMMDEGLTAIAEARLSANKKVLTLKLTGLPEDGGFYTVTAEIGGMIYTAGITLYDGVTPPPPIEPSAPEAPGTGETAGGSGGVVRPQLQLPFADVHKPDWYYDAVCWAYEQGIMMGTAADRFSPDQTVDRAMLVTILWRMEGCPMVNDRMPFTDVAPDRWYTQAVRWAAAMGIVKGTSETTFAPAEPLTREQAAVILYRYAGHTGMDRAENGGDLLRFGDGAAVSPYARMAMEWAVDHGYLKGDGQNLLPQSGMLRCQLAQLMMNFAKE